MGERSGRQHATPIHVDRIAETGTATALKRLSWTRGDSTTEAHSEAWLQHLIHRFPQTLPVSEVDPGFGALVPVCLELPTPAGFVDNLYVTAAGDLALVECKLWRNPEARREVVVQIIDYAQSLSKWSFEDLERGIAGGVDPSGEKVRTKLYPLVAEATDLSEEEFVDAVSRNLRLGRLLLLIVGDGIREGVEALSDYLQLHAGFHFALALVEMTVWQLPQGGYLVLPRVLARTVNIERGIVRLTEAGLRVEPPATAVTHPSTATRTTVSQDRLLEAIGRHAPEAPEAIRQLAAQVGDHGAFVEPAQKSLLVRWRGPNDRDFALGGFTENGEFSTHIVNWVPNELGLVAIAHRYLGRLAALVGGNVRQTKHPANWYVVREGKTQPGAMDILRRKDDWLALIDEYTRELAIALDSRSQG